MLQQVKGRKSNNIMETDIDKILNCKHKFYKEDDEEGGYYRVCSKCDNSEFWIKKYEEESKNKKLKEFMLEKLAHPAEFIGDIESIGFHRETEPHIVITLSEARKILESDANAEYFITMELRKFVDEHKFPK